MDSAGAAGSGLWGRCPQGGLLLPPGAFGVGEGGAEAHLQESGESSGAGAGAGELPRFWRTGDRSLVRLKAVLCDRTLCGDGGCAKALGRFQNSREPLFG